MFQKFYPSEDIRSTYDIDFERYYKEGYRGVIFDVDNTLVPHNAPADERAQRTKSESVLRGSRWEILCIQSK